MEEMAWVIFDEVHYMQVCVVVTVLTVLTTTHASIFFKAKRTIPYHNTHTTPMLHRPIQPPPPLQDRERGVVWEETIIFLPRQIRMVFLSATLSNATQFSSWVTHLHNQPCHVVYTDTRPTPLQHMMYPLPQHGVVLVRRRAGWVGGCV